MATRTKEKEPELAIVPTEVGSQDLAAVMTDEANKRALLTQYIQHHMKTGADYGTIKITTRTGKEVESKASLFKPGSEKFLSLFKLTATFKKDSDTWEMAGSPAGLFCYICELKTSKGQVVGEGRGAANLSEKQGWTVNNAIKIAEKRAQIDAVLRTGALSDFFTQDLEDMPKQGYDQSPIADPAVPTVSYDDPETPKTKRSPNNLLGKKNYIKELLDQISPVLLVGKEDYEKACKKITGLELMDSNVDEIIKRLKVV